RDGVGDEAAGDDGAQGRVAARQALADDDQVGDDAPVIDGEVPAGAADAGHHLVGDQKDVVPGADLSRPLPVAVHGGDGAERGADDRLGDEGGDGVGPLLVDGGLEVLD